MILRGSAPVPGTAASTTHMLPVPGATAAGSGWQDLQARWPQPGAARPTRSALTCQSRAAVASSQVRLEDSLRLQPAK